MAQTFMERLKAGEILIADGATGTNLQLHGLPVGTPPDAWVLEQPDQVLNLHRAFVEAGADIILTNTFGASAIRLADSPHSALEVNLRAAELARQAAGDAVLVAGSIGPTGGLMEPFGPLTQQAALETFAEQAVALAQGGVDLLVVETMFDLKEAAAALEGARQATDLPLVCSFSFDRGVHTMMGVTPTKVFDKFRQSGLAALGGNCGAGLEDMRRVLAEYAGIPTDLPLWIKPNAGLPHDHGNGPVWDLSPDEMGRWAAEFVGGGARIIGGCCGTSPAHLRAIADAVRAH